MGGSEGKHPELRVYPQVLIETRVHCIAQWECVSGQTCSSRSGHQENNTTLFSFFQPYLHTDQKLSSASLAVVFVKADLALDCVGSLSPATLCTLGKDMFSPHVWIWELEGDSQFLSQDSGYMSLSYTIACYRCRPFEFCNWTTRVHVRPPVVSCPVSKIDLFTGSKEFDLSIFC